SMLEEEKGEGKKFPLWIIGAGAAVLLIIIGILFISTGKKKPEPSTPPVAEQTQAEPSTTTETIPAPAVETPKQEVVKPQETKKQEEKQPTVEEKKQEEKPKPAEEKPKETQPLKVETPPVQETIPEKKEPVEEVKKPEPVVETPPPPPAPAVEEKKEPEKKETPPEKKVTYKTGDLVQPGTPGLIPPKKISDVAPVYPPIAKMQKIKGNVDVRVLVDEKGNVIEAAAISGNPIFKTEAENAARKTKFNPAEIDGVKVKCYYTLTFKFQ
ncbi:MAG: TonB family protein, partial [Thermoanaerobaculia bacterium]